jgi:hypothetical protein
MNPPAAPAHTRHPVAADPTSSAAAVTIWAAWATVLLSAAWLALFVFQVVALPTGWSGIEEYAARFSMLELANLWPALPLAWTYLMLLAGLHHLVAPDRQVWTLGGLALGVVYSTMATINYTVQIVMVAPNLLGGELDGMHVWAGANFDSVFWALALCYAVQALSMGAVAGALERTGWQGTVRRLFLLAAVSAPLQLGFGLLDWPVWVGVPATALWATGLIGGSAVLGVKVRSGSVLPT